MLFSDFFSKPYIAILNDSTCYQAEPGNADPEALPTCSQARQSLWTSIPRPRAWEPVIETDLGLLYSSKVCIVHPPGVSYGAPRRTLQFY